MARNRVASPHRRPFLRRRMMKILKIAVVACAALAFAGAASACPFMGKTGDKAADAPILKPSTGS